MKHTRTYRHRIQKGRLVPFRVVVQETDLYIHSKLDLTSIATELVLQYRAAIETFIRLNPSFATSLVPWEPAGFCPGIINEMCWAGQKAGVGPMAAVAGVIAQSVGSELLRHTDEIIVENGGDVFIKTHGPVTVGIYAGTSPLSFRIGLKISPVEEAVAVCTSSGTVGHSLSMGSADAVCVKSRSCALADAAATAIGNRVQRNADIEGALAFGKRIKGVEGIVVIRKDAMGVWGDLEVVGLKGKNP